MLEWYSSADFFDQDKVNFHEKRLDSCDCVEIVDSALELYYEVGCNPRSALKPLSLFHRCKSATATSMLKEKFESEEDSRTKMLTGIAYLSRTGDMKFLELIVNIPLDDFVGINKVDLLCLNDLVKFKFPSAPYPVYYDSEGDAHFQEEFKVWVRKNSK